MFDSFAVEVRWPVELESGLEKLVFGKGARRKRVL